MRVEFKKTIIEQVEEARIDAQMRNKEIACVYLTEEEARELYQETRGFRPLPYKDWRDGLLKGSSYILGINIRLEKGE
jgi:hypothetical protein